MLLEVCWKICHHKLTSAIIWNGNNSIVTRNRRLYFRKYSFSQRTVNEWNKLSADCVHSSSENRIDNYLLYT